jgi:hypothetical protein
MWLNLEVGIARSLRIRHKIFVDSPNEAQQQGGRRALVVAAAHTYFPEAALDDLPSLARSELEAGMTGQLRERIALADAQDANLGALRDQLVEKLGGSADVTGALLLLDEAYLSRAVHNRVSPVVTARCIGWYGHWRTGNDGPHVAVAAEMQELTAAWIEHPDLRTDIDHRIVALAQSAVRDSTTEILDTPV